MPSVQQWQVTEAYLEMQCEVGEAPLYESASHSLRFVDIPARRLHRVWLDKGPASLKTYELSDVVSITADVEGDDRILAANGDGFAWLDRSTNTLAKINNVWTAEGPEKSARMRFNDGCIDPEGRFWAGCMNNESVAEPQPEGILFRLDRDLSCHRILSGLTVPNGMAWTKDCQFVYTVDSTTRQIFRFRYHAALGQISDRQVFYQFDDAAAGMADGICLDEDDFLWVAVFLGSRVIRLDPQGNLVGEILLPTKAITCPAFVGTSLYITSARRPLQTASIGDEARSDTHWSRREAHLAGSLFRVEVGVRGQPVRKFRRQ